MTAAQFRARRVLEQRQDRGRRYSSLHEEPSDENIMEDLGDGDMAGDEDVWNPPTSGYRCLSAPRTVGKVRGSFIARPSRGYTS